MTSGAFENVYFIGIGGISMSSLARILHERGVRVAGFDFKESDVTRSLIRDGIPVFYTFSPANQQDFDTVVYTAAIRADDPELVCAKARGARLLSRAELLSALMEHYAHSVGVAGTHGKSTTTGMLCHIFESARTDATVLAGAVIPSLDSTYRIGHGDTAVFEACEYKNSYHAMRPTIRLVLNTELEHVDFFGTLDGVLSSFRTYLDNPSHNGENIAVINADCENSVKAAQGIGTKVYTFSVTSPDADFTVRSLSSANGSYSFDIYALGTFYCHACPGVPGRHNVSNALAAASAAYFCGIPGEAVSAGLASFGGVRRRFEKRGVTSCGVTVMDDYAHHPDEVTATLKTAKEVFSGDVWCIFQPHTYSRFEALLPDFARALSLADHVVMADVYAAREQNVHGVFSADILPLLPGAVYRDSFRAIAAYIGENARPGDTVFTMGAGDIDKIVPLLLS